MQNFLKTPKSFKKFILLFWLFCWVVWFVLFPYDKNPLWFMLTPAWVIPAALYVVYIFWQAVNRMAQK